MNIRKAETKITNFLYSKHFFDALDKLIKKAKIDASDMQIETECAYLEVNRNIVNQAIRVRL